jgi:hypothetical protein
MKGWKGGRPMAASGGGVAHGFVSTVIKLALICLGVGLVLSFFDIDPVGLLRNFPQAIRSVFDVVVNMIRWAVPYVLLGAVVVVPVWLVLFLLRMARDKRGRP